MLLLRWFSTHFARTIANSFSKLHECLVVSMDEHLILNEKKGFSGIAPRQKNLLDELFADSVQLDSAYSIAAFELRLGRISGMLVCPSHLRFSKFSSVESIKPLIGVVENIRRELSWGTSRAKVRPGEKPHAAMIPAGQLAQAILASMKYVEVTLLFVFERTTDVPGLGSSERETAPQILRQLDQARDAAGREFALFQHMDDDARKDENDGVTVEAWGHTSFFVSLIEVRYRLPKILATVIMTRCPDG
jgi:hypothetical protein